MRGSLDAVHQNGEAATARPSGLDLFREPSLLVSVLSST
jgi:hypothetical protein